MRKAILIFGIGLFIAGPVAKIYQLNYANNYLIASGLGLIIITVLAFVKQK